MFGEELADPVYINIRTIFQILRVGKERKKKETEKKRKRKKRGKEEK